MYTKANACRKLIIQIRIYLKQQHKMKRSIRERENSNTKSSFEQIESNEIYINIEREMYRKYLRDRVRDKE